MSNMSYCRFRNTLEDLRDCQEAMEDTDLSADESTARDRLLLLCADIVSDFEGEIEEIRERKAAKKKQAGA